MPHFPRSAWSLSEQQENRTADTASHVERQSQWSALKPYIYKQRKYTSLSTLCLSICTFIVIHEWNNDVQFKEGCQFKSEGRHAKSWRGGTWEGLER